MNDQDQQREHNRYQEWAAEKDEFESQQYHIYLEEEIIALQAQLAEKTLRYENLKEMYADDLGLMTYSDQIEKSIDEFIIDKAIMGEVR